MQHVLVDVVHLFGVHGLSTRVEAVQVTEQKLQSVSQLGEKEMSLIKSIKKINFITGLLLHWYLADVVSSRV